MSEFIKKALGDQISKFKDAGERTKASPFISLLKGRRTDMNICDCNVYNPKVSG